MDAAILNYKIDGRLEGGEGGGGGGVRGHNEVQTKYISLLGSIFWSN